MRKVELFGLPGGSVSQFIGTVCAVAVMATGLFAVATMSTNDKANAAARDATPIKDRNVDMKRGRAAKSPHTEADQPIVNGWPLYRTDRGQAAFNHAMATLKATDTAAPAAAAFKGCKNLICKLSLPRIGRDGWIPAGRLWVSPSQYVLFVRSPRPRRGRSYRRRGSGSMKYFVYHEFQNSTRNTDPYDTISAHKGSVFVPLYMGKQGTDARGNRYVVVVQVAPYDVRSVHASNKGSQGPGIEVAKNNGQKLQYLQGIAGILVGEIIKKASPRLRVVHHRGREGRPMLDVYKRRLAALRNGSRGPVVTLPFVPASARRVASVNGALGTLITRRGLRRRTLVAAKAAPRIGTAGGNRQNRVTAGRTRTTKNSQRRRVAARQTPVDTRLSPLAVYLKANIATMKRLPSFASIIPQNVAHVGEIPREKGTVYLLNAGQQVLGRVVAYRERGVTLKGVYVFMPANQAIDSGSPFSLDLSKPVSMRLASLSPGPAAALMASLVDTAPVAPKNVTPRIVTPRVVTPRVVTPRIINPRIINPVVVKTSTVPHQLIEQTRRASRPAPVVPRLVSR